MQHNATPDIVIRMTAWDHLNAHRQALRAAQALLAAAQTSRDRTMYRVWILNAERNIMHWQAQAERETP
jgi:hypothetical protein